MMVNYLCDNFITKNKKKDHRMRERCGATVTSSQKWCAFPTNILGR